MWKDKHFAEVGESRDHTSVIVVTKRINSADAIAQITFQSTEKSVFENSPNVEVFVKPLEIKYNSDGSEQKLEAGPITQLQTGKNSPSQKGKSEKIAELIIALQANSNATFLEVTTKIVGDLNNRSYVTVAPLSYEFSSLAIGGSTSREARQSSSITGASGKIRNAFTNSNDSAAADCHTITIACSCNGCPGCSTSKNCKDNCYPTGGSCNPYEPPSCSVLCCQC